MPKSKNKLAAWQNQSFGDQSTFVRPNDHPAKQPVKRKVLLSLIALLVISLSLTLYFGLNEVQDSRSSLELTIAGPVEIVSGAEVVYTIKYKNLEKADLTKINLTLIYPNGFYFKEAQFKPQNEGQSYWELPDLEANFGATLEVKGIVIGEIDELKEIKAVMTYEPANFSSTFIAEASLQQKVKAALVDMWIDYNSEALVAQDLLFKIHILNHDVDFEPLKIEFDVPEQYSVLETDPVAIGQGLLWRLDKLGVEAEAVFIIRGELVPDIAASQLEFAARLTRILPAGEQLLDEDEMIVKIVKPNIKVSLVFADGALPLSVNWDEVINYELTVINEGEYVPANLKLILLLNSNFINWQTWQDSEGLYREGNKIIWTKDNSKIGDKLANLAKDETIRLKIGARLQTAPIDANTLSEQDLIVSAVAKVEAPIGSDKYVSSSDILAIKIGQNIEFGIQVKYHDATGQAIGSGPIPPQVDEQTTYAITWQLAAGSNSAENINISAILPPYIEWAGSETDIKPLFNPITRNLDFIFSKLPAGERLSGRFDLSIKPTKNQIGQLLTLINPITLQATVNQKSVTKKYDSIDTNLIYDSQINGQGRVVE